MGIVLASGSPQRQELLRLLGVEFEVVCADVEELSEGEPVAVALANARAKLDGAARENDLVIAADTVVALDRRIFGKPDAAENARSMLRELSGREHEVITGISVQRPAEEVLVASQTTTVKFRALTDSEISWYVSLGEWKGRAGGYAIQERGALLVEKIDGDYLNVVGLPVAKLLEALPELTPNE